eukprot:scaffold278819_cov14-Prasinocladus_malaysianus.AAC.1
MSPLSLCMCCTSQLALVEATISLAADQATDCAIDNCSDIANLQNPKRPILCSRPRLLHYLLALSNTKCPWPCLHCHANDIYCQAMHTWRFGAPQQPALQATDDNIDND